MPPSARPAGQRVRSATRLRQSLGPQPDVDAVWADIDPLDQQLDDAGLLGREQLVPERVEIAAAPRAPRPR